MNQSLKSMVVKNDKLLISIALLRCLATFLITNTHLDNVYPTSALAVGGLLGDVLFFMISGYCLIESNKGNFFKWYGKRIVRIYPAVLIMTIVHIIVGDVALGWKNAFNIFVYPTFYVFVGAIMLLYIPFYFVAKYLHSGKQVLIVACAVAILEILYYIIFLDKSKYVMNAVQNPITLFLYGLSMYIGAAMRKYREKLRCLKIHWFVYFIISVVLMAAYAALLLVVRRKEALYPFQIIVNVVLLAVCVTVFLGFVNNESKIAGLPVWMKKVFTFIGSLTLEIYVVQLLLINLFQDMVFPLNLLLIAVTVVAAAFVLHTVIDYPIKLFSKLFSRIKDAKTQ